MSTILTPEYDIKAIKTYIGDKFYSNKVLYLHLEELLSEFPATFGEGKTVENRQEFVNILDYLNMSGFLKEIKIVGYFDEPIPHFDFLYVLGFNSIELCGKHNERFTL